MCARPNRTGQEDEVSEDRRSGTVPTGSVGDMVEVPPSSNCQNHLVNR